MKYTGWVLVALMSVAPSMARAHGSDDHAFDPNLHVGTGYDECFVKFAPELTQDAFARFAREFGSVSAFKTMAAPVALGKWGVELGLEQMSFDVEDKAAAWNDTFAHPNHEHPLGSTQVFPKASLRVGVTDKTDVGVYYTRNPKSNYGWLGVDVRQALMQQSQSKPISLAVRGAYTRTLYVSDMDMNTLTAEASAGRTLWGLLTPYVGAGTDVVLVRETSDAVNLHSESQFVPRGFGGAELRWSHLSATGEMEVGALNRFEMKVAAIF